MAPRPAELLQAAFASHKLGQLDQAERLYRAVLRSEPANFSALNNLSLICLARGAAEDALKLTRKAIKASPGSAEAHCNHGNALRKANRIDEAISSYKKALELQPGMTSARRNLGTALLAIGHASDAAKAFERVIAAEPRLAAGYRGLGDVSLALGLPEQAKRSYERALDLDPSSMPIRSNLLMCLNYLTGIPPEAVLTAHEDCGKHCAALHAKTPAPRDPSPPQQRRLRVGYVSSDFRRHSVSFFFAPLLAAHDRSRLETFCYADVRRADEVTRRLEAKAEHWIPISGVDDDALANQIRNDGIDVLIDLAGHTGHNRLGLFARKPAPVQATWLGYPNTTGLSTIDYRITDAIADPDGDEFYTETLIRLPRCFLCYSPLDDNPAVNAPPMSSTGQVTFGSFNDLNKINGPVIALWARLLSAIPDASLLLKARQFGDSAVRDRVAAQFQAEGIDPQRITMWGHTSSQAEHLAAYNRVDIALDSFPYNGATTTCEALWMGVPVVTLHGARHAGRVGASLLTAAGLAELVAKDVDDYIAIARRLARDCARLRTLRHGLRDRLQSSPLCDGPAFARAMEAVYDDMWRRSRNGGGGAAT